MTRHTARWLLPSMAAPSLQLAACTDEATSPNTIPPDDAVNYVLLLDDDPTASKPVPASLDGHQGLYLELTVPSDVCEVGYYAFWEGLPGDAQHTASPDAVERTWILDVDGERVVIVAIAAPRVPVPGGCSVMVDGRACW